MNLLNNAKAFAGFDFTYTMFTYSYSGTDKSNATSDTEGYSGDASSIRIPLIMGMEAKISESWTARFSLAHQIYDPSYESSDNTLNSGLNKTSYASNEDDSADTELNIGLSYKLGNFRFDWLANIDIFIEGPYILSGKISPTTGEASTPVSTAFAVTYLFDYSEPTYSKSLELKEK